MSNKPHDESVDLDDGEEVLTPPPNREDDDAFQASQNQNNLTYTLEDQRSLTSPRGPNRETSGEFPRTGKAVPPVLNEEDERGSGDDSDDEEVEGMGIEGAYDPNEFSNLPVSSEIKDLFQFILAYQPQTVEVESNLRPFVLDYIPAVGDIDAFIKIPRPDEGEDNLGLIILDEPSAKQSDSTVTKLKLKIITKDTDVDSNITVGKTLKRADKNPKEIDQWISSISELHKAKPATTVHYTKPMPDIDNLMQEWPAEFEDLLKMAELPTADMDMSLEEYVDTICTILDIPVHKSRIQALHVLFTLFSEFKNSQHFKALADENQLDNGLRDGGEDDEPDRLVL